MPLLGTDIVISGLNICAGIASISAATSNILLYHVSMRLIGLVVILYTFGIFLIFFEVFSNPNFLRNQSSHLTTYQGRAVQYLLLTLVATDNAPSVAYNKTFLIWSWSSGACLAIIAIIFALLAAYNALATHKLPLPKSMKERGNGESQHALIKDDNESILQLEKSSIPQNTSQHYPGQSLYTTLSSPSFDAFQHQSPRPSSGTSTKSSNRNVLGLYSSSAHRGGEANQRPKSLASTARYETTQERIGLQDGSEWKPARISRDSKASSVYQQLRFDTMHDSEFDSLPLNHSRKLGKKASRSHRRVYVPSIGTFELSSGSESEGEDEEVEETNLMKEGGDNEEDNDDASVYSLDSEVAKSYSEGLKVGRKLSRRETKKHQGKLHRGIQRALSQRGLASTSTSTSTSNQ